MSKIERETDKEFVYVCCVRERERVRETAKECVCVCVFVYCEIESLLQKNVAQKI